METLLALVLKEVLPATIEMVKAHHSVVNPDLPPLTDAEALELLQKAVASSLAKDDNWLASRQ